MGVYEDYVNGLEGKEDLNVLDVVKDLTKLHNEEIGTWDAKVRTQDDAIAARDNTIAEKDREVTRFKAMNLDLTMQIPGGAQSRGDENRNQVDPNTPEGRAATITPEDLFN